MWWKQGRRRRRRGRRRRGHTSRGCGQGGQELPLPSPPLLRQLAVHHADAGVSTAAALAAAAAHAAHAAAAAAAVAAAVVWKRSCGAFSRPGSNQHPYSHAEEGIRGGKEGGREGGREGGWD